MGGTAGREKKARILAKAARRRAPNPVPAFIGAAGGGVKRRRVALRCGVMVALRLRMSTSLG